MNKTVYLALSILNLRKTVMVCIHCIHYVKAKYDKKAKLCCIYTDSIIVYAKADDIYKDTVEDVETRLGTSNCELERSLHKEKNKKVIGIMKDELDRKIMK